VVEEEPIAQRGRRLVLGTPVGCLNLDEVPVGVAKGVADLATAVPWRRQELGATRAPVVIDPYDVVYNIAIAVTMP
jgi:hypothetical protein